MSDSTNLSRARVNINDEYYTLYDSIKEEIKHYKGQFKNKVVYCPCDNPLKSNFFKLFKKNFKKLGLKKLIASYYNGDVKKSLFGKTNAYAGYSIVDSTNYYKDTIIHRLQGNGDFRSQECISMMLHHADIVVTNPPFSLFRRFIYLMYRHNKKFLVIGHLSGVTYKEVFLPFKKDIMHIGFSSYGKTTMPFTTPDNKISSIPALWYTNLDYSDCLPFLKLTNKYTKESYKKLLTYDAINVNSMRDVPDNYYGLIAVPVSFITLLNTKQFKIIGITRTWDTNNGCLNKKLKLMQYKKESFTGTYLTVSNGDVLVEDPQAEVYYKMNGSDKKYRLSFPRLLIKRV